MGFTESRACQFCETPFTVAIESLQTACRSCTVLIKAADFAEALREAA